MASFLYRVGEKIQGNTQDKSCTPKKWLYIDSEGRWPSMWPVISSKTFSEAKGRWPVITPLRNIRVTALFAKYQISKSFSSVSGEDALYPKSQPKVLDDECAATRFKCLFPRDHSKPQSRDLIQYTICKTRAMASWRLYHTGSQIWEKPAIQIMFPYATRQSPSLQ